MASILATESQTAEKLWSVTLTGHRLACELHDLGDLGWEVRLYSDGWMFTSRRFVLQVDALEFSAELRRDYQGLRSHLWPSHGWSSTTLH